jgi:hypothetical protein
MTTALKWDDLGDLLTAAECVSVQLVFAGSG